MVARFIFMATTILFVADSTLYATPQTEDASTKNTVIVMGMIHSGHRVNEVYGLERIKAVVRQVNPDFVLTEIPPDRLDAAAKQYRETGAITESRVRVFPEYTDALFPLTKDKKLKFEIVPCAAWTKEMNESRRATMAKLKTSHAKQYEEMESARRQAHSKIKELGDGNDPVVIHTDEYDSLVKKGMAPYDRHFNELIGAGGWENINAAHYALIEKALDEHKNEGKTFLITFGSWHKYYIKEQLNKRSDVNIVSLSKYLNVSKENISNSLDDVGDLFSRFTKAWDDAEWENNFRGVDYMRTTDDEGWKTRMEVIQSLVAQGEPAISGIMEQLSSKHTPTRILAAQALGYLAPQADVAKLKKAFIKEQDPSARLYIVDAIGMSGKGASVDWKEIAKDENNRDVLKHINYAKERNESPVSRSVVDELVNWDPSTMDSALVGKPAPDFVLNSVDGQEFKLSQYKGKQPVVLVFIYGDT